MGRHLCAPWDTIGYKTENTSTPIINNWSAQSAQRTVLVQSCQYKINKLRSLFSPFFSLPHFSEPSRAMKRAQVFIDRLFKKVWLKCISRKLIEYKSSVK